MDRQRLREQTHNPKELLKLGNQAYENAIFLHTFEEINADLEGQDGAGDITTKSMFPEKQPAKGVIIAKEDGVIAGLEELKFFLSNRNFSMKNFIKDGNSIKAGDKIVEISADIHDLLAAERTILNLLTHMSGIATYTRKIVDSLAQYNVLVTATRKTLWGLLDKKAVALGGGGTHRLNLADAILIKDTHLDPINRDFNKAFARIAATKPTCRFIEIEVLSKEESIKAAKAYKKSGLKLPGVIMFDNISPEEISAALTELKAQNLYDEFLFEASGSINEQNLQSYAKTGVDIISMGALTRAHHLDLSMKTK